MASVKDKVYGLSILPNPPSQDITWDEVVNTTIKIPKIYNNLT
jgi:hypothetical protein